MSDRPGSRPDNRTLGDLADEMAAVLGEAFASAIFGLRGIFRSERGPAVCVCSLRQMVRQINNRSADPDRRRSFQHA